MALYRIEIYNREGKVVRTLKVSDYTLTNTTYNSFERIAWKETTGLERVAGFRVDEYTLKRVFQVDRLGFPIKFLHHKIVLEPVMSCSL